VQVRLHCDRLKAEHRAATTPCSLGGVEGAPPCSSGGARTHHARARETRWASPAHAPAALDCPRVRHQAEPHAPHAAPQLDGHQRELTGEHRTLIHTVFVHEQVEGYNKLLNFYMENKYTLRYCGGLVPDVYQQFTKTMGVFTNPTSEKSPAKLRLAFEASPWCVRAICHPLATPSLE
jgi:hypothetical protein